MECQKCNSKSFVEKTINKKHFTLRHRVCTNKKCRHRFKTVETMATGWDYQKIIYKIKDLLRDVK